MTSSCVPILKLLSSAGVEINRGPKIFGQLPPWPRSPSILVLKVVLVVEISRGCHNFWGAPVAQTPANFGPRSCFWQRYSMTPSYVPNLKSIASVVAKINSGVAKLGCAKCGRTPHWEG